MKQDNDYNLDQKIKIKFMGMDYFIMPRYTHHYLENDYEKFSLQILKNDLDAGSVFIDIGAHYGAYSLYAAQESKSKVIAIEPVIENYQLLNNNVRINGLDKLVTTYNYAASNKNGKASLNIPWASDSAGFYDHPNAETIKTQEVKVMRMDDIIDGGRVDLIKIDTEGHEVSVLEGLTKTLADNPNVKLIIELNPECLKRAGQSPETLFEIIRGFKKEVYIIDEENFLLNRITDNLEQWSSYLGSDGYANIYCVPSENHQFMMFVSHSGILGGAELALVDQIKALRKEKNILSHVILPEQGALQDLLFVHGISNTVITSYSSWTMLNHEETREDIEYQRRNLSNINASVEITKIASHIHPTIIVNNTIVCPWGCLAAKTLNLPLIWAIHEYGDKDHDIPFSHPLDKIRAYIVEQSDAVFCCSNAVRQSFLTGDRIKDKKIYTTYNLLDKEDIIMRAQQKNELLSTKKLGNIKLTILGTVTEGKGQIIAIEAVASLKKKGIKAELDIIGQKEKSYFRKLKTEVKNLNIENNVSFLEYQNNPLPFIKQSDAVLVCSRNEAFGRTTAEAMIIGTPVIGSDSGGTSEMLQDNKSGFLFKPMDSKDLATKIEKFSKTDTEIIIKNAQIRVGNLLDSDVLLDKIQTVLKDVTGTRVSNSEIFSAEVVTAINSLNSEIEDRNRVINNLEQKVNDVKEQLKATKGELVSIINSRSWRATKLFRLSRYIIKKFWSK